MRGRCGSNALPGRKVGHRCGDARIRWESDFENLVAQILQVSAQPLLRGCGSDEGLDWLAQLAKPRGA